MRKILIIIGVLCTIYSCEKENLIIDKNVSTSETEPNSSRTKAAISSNLIKDNYWQFRGFVGSDYPFAASYNVVYWQNGRAIYKGTFGYNSLTLDQTFTCVDFDNEDRMFAASGNIVYWQYKGTLRRGTISNNHVTVDPNFRYNNFSTSDYLFAASGNTVYWQNGRAIYKGTVGNGTLTLDQSFTYVFPTLPSGIKGPYLFAATGNTVYYTLATQVQGADGRWYPTFYLQRANVSNGMLNVTFDYFGGLGPISISGRFFASSNNQVYWKESTYAMYRASLQ